MLAIEVIIVSGRNSDRSDASMINGGETDVFS